MLHRPRRSRGDVPSYVDSPAGILTAGGVKFQTTVSLLQEYAGEVLEKVPLEKLIRRTEAWLASAQALCLWLLAVLLLVVAPLPAAGIALAVYILWEVLSPAFVSRLLASVFRVMEMPVVQIALYVVVLSVLGNRGDLAAVGVGLGGFLLVRWHLLRLALRPLVDALRRPLYTLPAPDQVLRAFVLRAALQHGISLPQIAEMSSRMPWRK